MNNALYERISTEIKCCNYLQADHLLRAHANDLIAGHAFIADYAEAGTLSQAQRDKVEPAAKRLKEIAREIIFSLSDRTPIALRRALGALMGNTASSVQQVLERNDIQSERASKEQSLIANYAEQLPSQTMEG